MDSLGKNTQIKTIENVFENPNVKELFTCRPSTRDQITIFGKTVDLPRYQKLYGNGTYRYSRMTMVADPNVPELVSKCIEYTREHFPEFTWDVALVNWYMTGLDYVSWHSDDESDLMEGSPILSFSFGGSRTFKVREKADHDELLVYQVQNNSCIIMMGDCQKECEHTITATKKHVDPRINVTVRSLKQTSSKKTRKE